MPTSIPLGFLNTKAAIESTPMEGAATEMRNVMLRDGTLAPRDGFASFAITGVASPVQDWYRYTISDGTEFDVVKARDGKLYSASAGNGSFAQINSASGCGATYGSFFQRDDYLYYCTGSQNVAMIYGNGSWATTRTIGPDAPTETPTVGEQAAGGLAPGKYVYAISAYDEDARVWSVRSPYSFAAEMDESNSGATVAWTKASFTIGGQQAPEVMIWRAPAEKMPSGYLFITRPFRLVSSTSNAGAGSGLYGDQLPDNALGEQYLGLGSAPPSTDIACYHNDRAYYASGGTLWFSERGRPEMVPQIDTRTFAKGKGDPLPFGENRKSVPARVTGLASYGGRLYVFTATDTYVLSGDGHQAPIVPSGFGHGCAFHKSIVLCKYGMFWFGADGLCWSDGKTCRVLSEGVIDFDTSGVSTRLSRSALNGSNPVIGTYDAERECVVMKVEPFSGSGSWMLVYDCRRGGFLRWMAHFESAAATITSMCCLRSATTAPRLLASTASPDVYELSSGTTQDDGANLTCQWTGWFGQSDIDTDKTWGDPRISFASGGSGSTVLSLAATQDASTSDANESASVTLDPSDIGPHTPPMANQTGRLCRLDITKTTDGAMGITELYVSRRKVGPRGGEVDKA